MANRIRKGDDVIVLAGKDKGKRGKVQRVLDDGLALSVSKVSLPGDGTPVSGGDTITYALILEVSNGPTTADVVLTDAQLADVAARRSELEAALARSAEDNKVLISGLSRAWMGQALALAEEQIEARLAALVAAEEDLAATISVADSAAEEDIARLTAVYENMKPKDAAALFEEMAPEFAAGFLGRMRPDAAGAVMAGLDPKTAYTISVLLAGRNADVPKN